MEKTITKKTTDGLIWNTLQKMASKGLQFLFSVLIARILIPEQYGLIAIANLFISLSDVLIDSGFSKALLRKDKKTREDYCTVFWFNMGTSVFLYFVLFLTAPLIGRYYDSETLIAIIRVISLSLIINAACGIQSLHLIADMNFRKLAFLETIAMAIGGVAGLICAIKGVGVWALVAQTLVGCFSRTLLIWGFSKWKPVFLFSIPVFKDFFSFGFRLLVSEFAGRLYGAAFTFVIGKRFSSSLLGLYSKADAFASAPSSMITGPLSSVTFPAIVQIQNEEERLHKNYISMVRLSAFLIIPVFIGLSAVAEAMVPALLTDKWNGMIPFLQILSFSYLFTALNAIPQNYLLLFGESGSILRIQLITKIIGLLLLIPLARVSLTAVCIDLVFVSFLTLALSLFFLKKKARYRIADFLNSVVSPLTISIIMGLAVYGITRLFPSRTWALIIGVLSGILFFGVAALLFQRKQLSMISELLRPYLPETINKHF